MLQLITNLLGGGLIGQVGDLIEKRERAQTERERAQYQAQIDLVQARLRAQVEGQGSWLPKLIQALFALPFVLYLWKLIVWDKILAYGVTDPLGPYETALSATVVGFYFLTSGAAQVARIIRR